MHFSKRTKSKIHIQTNFMYFDMLSFLKKNHISCIRKCILKNKQKEKFMHFHASNIHLPTRSKWRTTTISSQYKVISIQNLPPSRLSTRSKWKKKNNPLVSVQGQNEQKRPSRLSIRSLQSKIYDPLVSVQGQNEKTTLSSQYKVNIKKKTTLSSQYKITSIQNLRPSCLSSRSKWKKKTTLSS